MQGVFCGDVVPMKTKLFIPARTSLQSNHPVVSGYKCREIMVPVDFSMSSLRALRHAAVLAQKENAHLTLLNVIDEPLSFRSLDKPSRERSRLASRASGLEELVARELPPGVAVHIVVCEGNPATEITRVAAQRRTDLIVVGCHRHHWLVRLFRGHTAARVIEQSPCPVVVLNEARSRRHKLLQGTWPENLGLPPQGAQTGASRCNRAGSANEGSPQATSAAA